MPRKGPRIRQAVGETSRTKQAPRDDTDINFIMAKYLTTGQLPHLNTMPPEYGDFTRAQDLHEALETVAEARDQFDNLPSAIRSYCDNDPVKLEASLTNVEDRQDLVDLGLVIPTEETAEEPAGSTTEETPSGG